MPKMQEATIPNDIGVQVPRVRKAVPLHASGSSKERKELLRQRFRKLARESLYFLTKSVLGYSDLSIAAHWEYCQFLQDLSSRRTLDLMPRGVYKTTIGTIGFAVWYLLNHKNAKILIANQVVGNAQIMLREVEQHFEGGNSMMNWLFPEFIKPYTRYKPWSDSEMSVPCRDTISGTPSIMVIGVGGKAESLHFDVIINDDIIGEKARDSSAEMQAAIAWHDFSSSLFVPSGPQIERCHGTRWSLSDLYATIIENPMYKVMIKSARDPNTGELSFPNILTDEFLRGIRDTNYVQYMSQYMNEPDNPEMLDFRKQWLRFYQLIKTSNGPTCTIENDTYYVKDMHVGLFVDPAGSGDVDMKIVDAMKKGRYKKANNAIGIVGLHGSGRYFVLDMWVGRGTGENPEEEVARRMLELARRWSGYVSTGWVESYGAQRALITVFNMICRENSFFLKMEETPRGVQKANAVRIRSALGYPAHN